jgi:hypothetical protein
LVCLQSACDAAASALNNRLKRSCRRRRDVANTFDEWGRGHAGRYELTAGKIIGFFATAKLWLYLCERMDAFQKLAG